MTKFIKIKKATIKDAKTICNIRNRIIKEGKATIDKLSTMKKEKQNLSNFSSREVIFLIKKDNTLVGLQSLTPLVKGVNRMKHVGEIDTYILPDYRKIGLGKKLFKETLRFARSKYYEKLVVFIRKTNIPSLKFHRNLGFMQVGKLSRQIKIGNKYEDELILELFI